MVESVLAAFGHIDILVNNAGIFTQALVEDLPIADWDRVVNVNLRGTFLCTHFVLPHLLKQGGGRIINIASQLGYIGGVEVAHYCASKGGVIAFTKAWLARSPPETYSSTASRPAPSSPTCWHPRPRNGKRPSWQNCPLAASVKCARSRRPPSSWRPTMHRIMSVKSSAPTVGMSCYNAMHNPMIFTDQNRTCHPERSEGSRCPGLGASTGPHFKLVILSAAKESGARPVRPFAALRVTRHDRWGLVKIIRGGGG